MARIALNRPFVYHVKLMGSVPCCESTDLRDALALTAADVASVYNLPKCVLQCGQRRIRATARLGCNPDYDPDDQ
jgi:hypothetical protein